MCRLVWIVSLLFVSAYQPGVRAQQRAPDLADMRRLWDSLKSQLAGPNGEQWFRENLQDSELPYLFGTLLAATPEDHPELLLFAISDKTTPKVSLQVNAGLLPKKLQKGAVLLFQGVATNFTREPFRLTIEADQPVRVHDPGQ